MKKVLAITTIRSDYDLLSGLYKLLHQDSEFELKLLVSGAHLSSTYGLSIDQIKKDGLDILLSIESLIDSNSKQSRLKTASVLLQNSIDIVAHYNPDLIIYAGDREDVIIGALLGGYLQIPTVHMYGGDHVPDGHIDNPIRHAVSKLSSFHLVAIDNHKERLLRLGEHSDRIRVIGSISLDRFTDFKPLSKEKIKRYFNIDMGFEEFALVIFHPHDIEIDKSHIYFENILLVLKELKINAFVSFPNTDPGNRNILAVIEKYANDSNFVFYKNLNRNLFLSIYVQSMLQVGNSSSGIIEAASIPIPVVNVGMRQVGRISNGNVIFAETKKDAIKKAIIKALSKEFLLNLKNMSNNYGDGASAQRAYKIIKETDFRKFLYKMDDPLRKY